MTIAQGKEEQKITAHFNPELKERSDLSKIAFGNRKGSASEKRMTLDLSTDLYLIASDSRYNGAKSEPGKDNATHDNVQNWLYFVTDLIYEDEQGNQTPCYMNIDVKQREDGEFFYSFAIEKGVAPQTLLAAVAGNNPTTTPNNNVPQTNPTVKPSFSFSSPKSDTQLDDHVFDVQDDGSIKTYAQKQAERAKAAASNELDAHNNSMYNENSQYRTMWTIEDGILSKKEVAAFYSKISELNNNYRNYRVSAEGDYIFEVGNKIIYTDGVYDYPMITRVK